MDTGEQIAITAIGDNLLVECNRLRTRSKNLESGLKRIGERYHKKMHLWSRWEDCTSTFCREVHSMLQES